MKLFELNILEMGQISRRAEKSQPHHDLISSPLAKHLDQLGGGHIRVGKCSFNDYLTTPQTVIYNIILSQIVFELCCICLFQLVPF